MVNDAPRYLDRWWLRLDSGKLDQALAEVEKQYALGEKSNDAAAMAGDMQLKGNILLEMGRHDDAKKAYEQALKTDD